jgi:hypothetical protein
MKNIVTKICLILSAVIILDSMGIWHMLVAFFFVGIIPGTDIMLAPILMIYLMLILSSLVIGVFVALPIIRKYSSINVRQTALKPRRLSRV